MIKYKTGNLISEAMQYDVICHGCNCFTTFGKGFALLVKANFPEAYEVDCKTKKGDIKKLGTISYTQNTTPIICNCYTQHKYFGKTGPDGADPDQKMHLDYFALKSCMKEIKKKFSGMKIGFPKIGAQLAGGDWKVIERIINEVLDGEDVTVVLLKEQS